MPPDAPSDLLLRELQARYRQATEIERLIAALNADLIELRQQIAALEHVAYAEGQQ